MADSEGAVAPAVPASETPPTRRIGRFAVAGSVVVSAAVHVLLIAPGVILTSRLLQSGPAQSVTVDLVTPQELAAISQKAAEPEDPKPSPPTPQQPPADAAQSPASSTASASADAFAMPFLPPPAPSTPEPTLGPAAQLATLVGAPSVTDQNGGGPSEFRADLTSDEIAAFAARVQSCWAAPADLAREPKLYVVLRVSLRRDGGLSAEPALQAGSASTLGPALMQSAMQALKKCQPYGGLPAAKYDEWRILDLRFTAAGISTASTVSGGHRTPRSG